MLKNALTVAALCSALPALAATRLTTDGSFEDAVLTAGIDDTFAGTPGNPWTVYSASFIGTGKLMPWLFAAADTDDSTVSSLDDIDVFAVPEPGTMAMMAAGLLGLLGLGVRHLRAR